MNNNKEMAHSNKKTYIAPQTAEIYVDTESLLNSFSTGGGDITGPVGAKPNGGMNWYEEENSILYNTHQSVWGDDTGE